MRISGIAMLSIGLWVYELSEKYTSLKQFATKSSRGFGGSAHGKAPQAWIVSAAVSDGVHHASRLRSVSLIF